MSIKKTSKKTPKKISKKTPKKTSKKISKKIQNALSKYTSNEILEAIKLFERRKKIDAYWKSMNKPVYPKYKVDKIIKKYDKKMKNNDKILVICHGNIHEKKFENSLLLNRANIQKPDIVSNAWSEKKMKYLPKDYFDVIIMNGCPLGNPFRKQNDSLWKNLYRILKPDGKIINSSILGLYAKQTTNIWYSDMTKIDKRKIKRKVNEYIRKMNFRDIKHIKDPEEKGDEITTMKK